MTDRSGPSNDATAETEAGGRLDEEQYEYEESYNVAPPTMPPAAAGANAEVGGEAAASRRHAGLPRRLLHEPEHRPGEPTPGHEPILGYDSMDVDTLLDWIEDADPSPVTLEALLDYERTHRDREAVVDECVDRLQRFSGGSTG